MDDNIAVIHDHPAIAGVALFLGFLFEFLADIVNSGIGERIEHAVAGAGADDEIIGKRCNAFQVEQDNIFSLFIFQRVDDFAGKVKRVQNSPQFLMNKLSVGVPKWNRKKFCINRPIRMQVTFV